MTGSPLITRYSHRHVRVNSTQTVPVWKLGLVALSETLVDLYMGRCLVNHSCFTAARRNDWKETEPKVSFCIRQGEAANATR